MQNREIIQRSLDYIEAHINTSITPHELAETAGFSLFHFYRIFQTATGFPVKQYILRRRLLYTVYAMRCGSKGIHAALKYGFETYAGFYKAFLREFGCTPQTFIKNRRAKRPIRQNLFTEEHMTVTHKKAADILSHWNLEAESITDIYYANTGEKNTHALYIGDSYVLKFTASFEKLKSNITLAAALEKAGLCAATPIRTTENKPYVSDDEIYFYLTKRLPGRQVLTSDFYAENGNKTAQFIGKILGQLHEALEKLDLPVHDADLLDALSDDALQKSISILSTDDALCTELFSKLQALRSQLPRQIIHRDPNPGNIIFDGKSWGFIDFELSERNIRIFDPCYAATAILSESFADNTPEQNEIWFDIYHSIFLGYDSIASLSPTEREAVPYVLLANQMICVAWFSEQAQYREQFEANRKMTLWLIEHFDQLKLE